MEGVLKVEMTKVTAVTATVVTTNSSTAWNGHTDDDVGGTIVSYIEQLLENPDPEEMYCFTIVIHGIGGGAVATSCCERFMTGVKGELKRLGIAV
ncbi:hypothetical protein GCM10007416_31700 [Kroppenstedtia guangzhouensis]|uniref:Uncharacterized protein n=1 Tax=Kroppenstedtia guangzhouensis TaxID=1274356 RepID=A0ABQ1H394_9BACL|nr:hypothetical protein [Kroppenstedtia guangzhouensis]GGA56178.1 hypothetical protein GCM10007416_31700 [Kroppenstedtia guangzhouensis]